jgi:hypothetical protein
MSRLSRPIIYFGIFFLFALVCSYLLFPGLWRYYSPFPSEQTAFDASESFARALRLNDPVAYEWSDPALWPKIDEWMATNKVRECEKIPDEQFTGGYANGTYDELFYCLTAQGWYRFDVYDMVIEETEAGYRVMNWGKIDKGAGW